MKTIKFKINNYIIVISFLECNRKAFIKYFDTLQTEIDDYNSIDLLSKQLIEVCINDICKNNNLYKYSY